ncbi:hypothetical protein MPSEU_000688500 [Mayamaea pseudoterrestris]|nr:hypothetical protein MPSEU_000688500 [Mayamaea pseudoterrestris]
MSLLSHTVALVTGASSGLGLATAQYLVRHGAKVVMADVQASQHLNESSSEQRSIYCHTDVTSEDSVKNALDLAERTFGRPVNAAINCAGIAIAKKTLSKKGPHPLSDFSQTMQVNLIGSFNVARLAAERMSQCQPNDMVHDLRGCIVNTASIAAYEGQIGQVAYAASKGGIVGMTLPMARELAAYKIRVMTIAPGLFQTPLLEGLPPDVKQQLGESVPCPRRLGHPDEFASLVGTILTSPYMNGSVIRLDGALRMPP